MIHIVRDFTDLGQSQRQPRRLSPPLITVFWLVKWSLILAASVLAWIGLGLFARGMLCLFKLGFYGHI